MNVQNPKSLAGAIHLLEKAGNTKRGETVLLVVDENTKNLADIFESAAKGLGLSIVTCLTEVGKNHGEEPIADVAAKMRTSTLIVALTTFSLAHSKARQEASASGARFLSLPQYSEALLSHEMVLVDYQGLSPRVKAVSETFTRGNTIHMSSAAGTDLTVDISGRFGNYCPGFVEDAGNIGSPPDIEANISPIESSASGVAVIDGSITHPSIGLLDSSVRIEFLEGVATDFSSGDPGLDKCLSELFQDENWRRRVLAEIGIGLNPAAELTGLMLSDEGALGTAHLGLGSNFYVGGKNLVDFHLDFVIRDVSLSVDNVPIMANGVFVLNESGGI